jgi:modulator of FtsH protease
MSGWDSFFVAQVGASAAVAGLVFVGVSINLDKILKYAGLPGRALALIVLILALITSSLMLVPGQLNTLIGAELLGVGLLAWIWVVALDALNLRQLEPRYRKAWVLLRIALSQFATLPIIIAGAVTLAQGTPSFYWLVPGVLVCFLVAFFDAWVLLIKINRQSKWIQLSSHPCRNPARMPNRAAT